MASPAAACTQINGCGDGDDGGGDVVVAKHVLPLMMEAKEAVSLH